MNNPFNSHLELSTEDQLELLKSQYAQLKGNYEREKLESKNKQYWAAKSRILHECNKLERFTVNDEHDQNHQEMYNRILNKIRDQFND